MKNYKPTHNADGLPISLHDDHPRPKTRREFLGAGLISWSGYLYAPSILNMIFGAAQAKADGLQCPVPSSALPPFLQINLAGGPNMPGAVVQTDINGQPLSNYGALGLGTQPSFKTAFNGVNLAIYSATTTNPDGTQQSPAKLLPITTPPSTNLPPGAVDPFIQYVHQFWQGFLGVIPTGIQKNISVIPVPNQSQDDSASNPKSISGLVQVAGVAGTTLPSMGTRNTSTGIGQVPVITNPGAPLIVNSYADVQAAVGLHSNVVTQLKQDTGLQQSLLNLISSLSSGQVRQLASAQGSTSSATLSQLVQCATTKNFQLTADPSVAATLDPGANASVAAIWSLGNNGGQNAMGTSAYGQAAIAYNVIMGSAGTGGIDLGGNDYHGTGQTNADTVDFRNGQLAGRCISTAAAVSKPLYLYITADGCTGSAVSPNVAPPAGDSGSRGCDYIIVYDPTGRPTTRTGLQSIGGFTNAQSVDTSVFTGGSAQIAAQAVFINYLSYAKQMSIASTLFPANTSAAFSAAQMNTVQVLTGGAS